jgi:GT2 family glycosyltransferase
MGLLWERLQASRLEHRPTGPAACLSGAGMLARREALEQIGLMDEGFDFYFEDAEWCHRAQKHGWKLGFVAEAEVVHLGDHSLSKVKVWAKQSEYRSAIRYYQRYYGIGPAKTTLIRIATLIGYSIRWLAFKFKEAFTGKAGYSTAYAELIRWIGREKQENLAEPDRRADK